VLAPSTQESHALRQLAATGSSTSRSAAMNAPVNKLAADVKVLAADVEELIKATATQSGEKIAAARERVQNALASASETLTVRGRQAVRSADDYVHDNPWAAVGVAGAFGLIIGILIARR
jgi:ElaB/YqjD/DUF883 family membrane-anchored ribosome-binding protein